MTLTFDSATTEQTSPQAIAKFTCFASYFDTKTGAIGRVVGSEKEPAGSHQFFI